MVKLLGPFDLVRLSPVTERGHRGSLGARTAGAQSRAGTRGRGAGARCAPGTVLVNSTDSTVYRFLSRGCRWIADDEAEVAMTTRMTKGRRGGAEDGSMMTRRATIEEEAEDGIRSRDRSASSDTNLMRNGSGVVVFLVGEGRIAMENCLQWWWEGI